MRKETSVHIPRFLTIVLVCLVVLLGAALRISAQDTTAGTEPAAATDDAIVATVNGDPIYQSDVDALNKKIEAAGGFQWGAPSDAQLAEELIRRKSVESYLAVKEVKVTDEEVAARLKEIEERVTADGLDLDEILKQRQMTRNELQEIIQIEMGMNRLAEAKLTDEELAGLDEQVRASHILVGVPQPNPNEEDFTKAKEKILTIKAEIEAGTKTFEAAAAEYSDCPSKAKGGDLGFFPRQGAMVEPFAEAAYALKVGEMSEPVRTQFGYHLIKPTERSKEPAKEALINSKIMDVVRDIEKVVKVERLYEGAPEDEAITPEDEVAPDDTGSDAGDGAPETE